MSSPYYEIYTLSLHDALPIFGPGTLYDNLQKLLDEELVEEAAKHGNEDPRRRYYRLTVFGRKVVTAEIRRLRSEEHTSELQSRGHLVCRLLLEKKKYVYNSI